MNRSLILEPDKCIGCYACVVACRIEHISPGFSEVDYDSGEASPSMIWVDEKAPLSEDGRPRPYFTPIACRHCVEAPCIGACPESALYRDEKFGAVLIREDKCIGCEACLDACDYDAPRFFEGKLIKCNLCIHRLEQGLKIACEQACAARAIFIDPVRSNGS